MKYSLFFLRIAMGWLFLYAGITKVLNPDWSAAGYMKSAKILPELYQWLASPTVLPITNFVNEWALTLLGVSLILGIGVRLSSMLGAVLMLLYWLPLGLPMQNPHSYIVDEHIIYAASLLVLGSLHTENIWGLEPVIRKIFKKWKKK